MILYLNPVDLNIVGARNIEKIILDFGIFKISKIYIKYRYYQQAIKKYKNKILIF